MAPNTVKPSSYGAIAAVTIAKSDGVLNAAAKAGRKVPLIYGYNKTADHNNRHCVDYMHYGNAAIRDWLVGYLRANAKRLGVNAIISNGHVMGFPSNNSSIRPTYRGPEGEWRVYTGSNPHTDHVHVQFNDAPIRRLVVPPALKPKPKPVPAAKSIVEIAREVWAGKWGNGSERTRRLKAAGYNPATVQRAVDAMARQPARKSNDQIANEVIAGKWGNGNRRTDRLRAAGYDPKAIQALVNRKLR